MLVVFAHIAEKPSANRVQAAIPSRFDGTNLISFELRSPASMPTPSPHPALLYSFQFISSPARSRSFAFFPPVRTFSLHFALSQLNTLYCFILLPFLSFVLTTSKKKKLFNCLCELVRLCVHMFFLFHSHCRKFCAIDRARSLPRSGTRGLNRHSMALFSFSHSKGVWGEGSLSAGSPPAGWDFRE